MDLKVHFNSIISLDELTHPSTSFDRLEYKGKIMIPMLSYQEKKRSIWMIVKRISLVALSIILTAGLALFLLLSSKIRAFIHKFTARNVLYVRYIDLQSARLCSLIESPKSQEIFSRLQSSVMSLENLVNQQTSFKSKQVSQTIRYVGKRKKMPLKINQKEMQFTSFLIQNLESLKNEVS